MMASSIFVLYQNYFFFLEIYCFISTVPLLVDGSHLENWISTSVYNLEDIQCCIDAFQLILDVDDLYQPYHELLQPHISLGTAISLAVTSFRSSIQASPVKLYSALCDCSKFQSICSYCHGFEFFFIRNCYNIMK